MRVRLALIEQDLVVSRLVKHSSVRRVSGGVVLLPCLERAEVSGEGWLFPVRVGSRHGVDDVEGRDHGEGTPCTFLKGRQSAHCKQILHYEAVFGRQWLRNRA